MSELILANMSELNVDDPIIDLLNKFLKANLPAISKATQKVIIENHLDPKEDVAKDSKDLVSINFGICEAKVKASYTVSHLTGLSSLSISSFEIARVDQNPNDINAVIGTAQIEAKLGSDIKANLGGSLSAGCGKINEKADITGTAIASNVTAKSNVSFNAGINGVKLCLKSLDITEFSIDYTNVSVDIDNLLDIFKPALKPLENLFLDLFKGEIKSLIASNVKSAVQEQVNGHLPFCVGLPF